MNFNQFYLTESNDIKTINDFYIENNIDEDKLSYLGEGDFGTAYSIGDGRVLKLTSSNSEFDIAKKLESLHDNKNIESFAKIFKTDIIKNQKYIILEELEIDSNIENLFYELQELLEQQGLPIQYLDNFDDSDLDISNELQEFINGIVGINHAYRYIGIEASDIRPENLGYSLTTHELKAFDIEDRQRTR